MRDLSIPALRPGDTIGVYSPSEPLHASRRERFAKGVHILENMGFRVRVDEDAYAHHHYMAGTRKVRIDAFNRLLRDPDVRMLMASWGGKSSNQLLDGIDYDALKRDPKLVCGFSDPANILCAIYAKTRLPTLYGPDVVGKLFEDPAEDLQIFKDLLTGGKLVVSKRRAGASVVVPGKDVEGCLIGGNLSSFVEGVLNTEFQPDLAGAIFFWETASPKPRELHQTLTYLRHCGVFENIGGMVMGYLGGVQDPRDWANLNPAEVVREELGHVDFPIVSLPVFGHGDCPKIPIPVGVRARLTVAPPSLQVLEPLVKGTADKDR